MSTSNSKRGRLVPLDGLRGFASLYVIAAHLFPLWRGPETKARLARSIINFGWSGVDLFFVLSGFLITGILLKSKEESARRYFGVFYARRFLRVFPIYYCLLVVLLILVPRLSMFRSVNYFWVVPGHAYPYWTYLSNWNEQLHGGTHLFLSVCWSLAIEEQYYVVWPLIVWCTGKRGLAIASIGLFALSAALRTYLLVGAHISAETVFPITFTHLDGIALGSALAILWRDRERHRGVLSAFARSAPALGAALLAVVLYAALTHPDGVSTAYVPAAMLAFPLIVLFYGSVLIGSVTTDGALRAVFSSSFLRMLGKYSYAAYLFQFVAAWMVDVVVAHAHRRFPILPALESPAGLVVKFGLQVAATYSLAALSWKVLEGPLNAFKDRTPLLNPRLAAAASSASAQPTNPAATPTASADSIAPSL